MEQVSVLCAFSCSFLCIFRCERGLYRQFIEFIVIFANVITYYFHRQVGLDASQGITPRHPSDSRPSSKSSDHRSGPQTPDTVVGTASANLLNKLDVEDLQSGEESHTRRSSIESNDSSVLSDAKRRSVDYTLGMHVYRHILCSVGVVYCVV